MKVGVVICTGIKNTYFQKGISEEINNTIKNVKEKFQEIELSEYPVIRKWRDIYKDFGEKKAALLLKH